MSNKTLIVIPARMDSSRLPGKPLLMAGGKAMIHHVYDRAKVTIADEVIITSGDTEIANYCDVHNLRFFHVGSECSTGTVRQKRYTGKTGAEITGQFQGTLSRSSTRREAGRDDTARFS